jgi:maltose alpha-D-glucosyltransferase/alpha-amylase
MWDYYAANPRARINLGIRRRLAPLMQNDRRRIELMFSLLMSMPGTPVLYYGDEIGMGDNILLEDRHGVRTAMQWSPDRNGGFSRCDPAQLFLPAINDPVYGYDAVNVEAQDRDPSSRLSWVRRLIGERKRHRALGRGVLGFILPENQQVLVYTRQLREEDEVILCVCNISEQMQVVDVDLRDFAGRVPVELFGRAALPAVSEAPYRFTLSPYGFYWLRLCRPQEVRGWAVGPAALAPPFETIVLREGWEGLSGPAGDHAILLRSIRHYMHLSPDETLEPKLVQPLEVEGEPALAVLTDLVAHGRVLEHLYIPLTLSWEDAVGTVGWWRLPQMLCRVRRVNRIGGLMDAGVAEPGNEVPLAALYEVDIAVEDGRLLRLEPDAATLTDARGESVRYMRMRR